MAFIIEKCILLLLLLSFNSVQSATNSSSSLFHLTNGYDVHVVNNLPSNSPGLRVHCASGNDELINGPLGPGQDYHWHFHMSIGKTTMYFCHFWWGQWDKSFEVFNFKIASDLCIGKSAAKTDHNICYWSVQADGFYFRTGPASFTKREAWK